METLPLREPDKVQFTRMARGIRLFADMQTGLLEKILAWVRVCRYKKGEKICREGELGDSFFVVYEGRVSVRMRRGLFFSHQAAVLGPGDCFGEMALLRKGPRNATVVCEEDSGVFMLRSEDFDEARRANPAFAEAIAHIAREREFQNRPT